jgi:hypothetical protein
MFDCLGLLATESDSVNDIFIVSETKFDNEDYWKATDCVEVLSVVGYDVKRFGIESSI